MKTWTLRLPEELFTRLREEHAQSYPEHRLSFNRWLLRLLESGLTTNGGRTAPPAAAAGRASAPAPSAD